MNNVVVYSGGLDSTVLLCRLLERDRPVRAVTFDYGQRHGASEIRAAKEIMSALQSQHAFLAHDVIDLSSLAWDLPGSSQTEDAIPVPLGHYADPSMKATIVPNRNMIMLSVAAGICMAHGGGSVYFGAHRGDREIYNDCREPFCIALNQAFKEADDRKVNLERPFITFDKAQIVTIGAGLREYPVPFEKTWSCYQGGTVHCGACGTCIERREAFRDAGIVDPTEYAPDAPDLETVLASFSATKPNKEITPCKDCP